MLAMNVILGLCWICAVVVEKNYMYDIVGSVIFIMFIILSYKYIDDSIDEIIDKGSKKQ